MCHYNAGPPISMHVNVFQLHFPALPRCWSMIVYVTHSKQGPLHHPQQTFVPRTVDEVPGGVSLNWLPHRLKQGHGGQIKAVPCKAKRQYLLACKASRHCLLALYDTVCKAETETSAPEEELPCCLGPSSSTARGNQLCEVGRLFPVTFLSGSCEACLKRVESSPRGCCKTTPGISGRQGQTLTQSSCQSLSGILRRVPLSDAQGVPLSDGQSPSPWRPARSDFHQLAFPVSSLPPPQCGATCFTLRKPVDDHSRRWSNIILILYKCFVLAGIVFFYF